MIWYHSSQRRIYPIFLCSMWPFLGCYFISVFRVCSWTWEKGIPAENIFPRQIEIQSAVRCCELLWWISFGDTHTHSKYYYNNTHTPAQTYNTQNAPPLSKQVSLAWTQAEAENSILFIAVSQQCAFSTDALFSVLPSNSESEYSIFIFMWLEFNHMKINPYDA